MIPASYFDGQSSRANSVQLQVLPEHLRLLLADGSEQNYPWSQVRVDESFKGATRRIELGGGAVLEVADKASLQTALAQVGIKPSLVQQAQSSWSWVAVCFAGLIGVVLLSYYVLIPGAAKLVAQSLPMSVDVALGDQAWPIIEEQMFAPSKLPKERQDALRQKFDAYVLALKAIPGKHPPMPEYRLEFRGGNIGANAIAVPGGRLVLTDDLVALAKSDEALIGVLFHELGHIRRRHSMRMIVQATAVTALVSIWLGDVSSIAASLPTALANMKYSRDLETEADDDAIAALKALGLPGQATAELFEALEGQVPDQDKKRKTENNKTDSPNKSDESTDTNAKSSKSSNWWSSHPETQDRIQRFRELR